MDEYFPESMGVRMIAEPGRFFVASAFTLAVNVIAKRAVPRGEGNPGRFQYTTCRDCLQTDLRSFVILISVLIFIKNV